MIQNRWVLSHAFSRNALGIYLSPESAIEAGRRFLTTCGAEETLLIKHTRAFIIEGYRYSDAIFGGKKKHKMGCDVTMIEFEI